MKYKIGLSEKNTLELLPDEIIKESLPLLDFANNELQKFYKGKYKFSITEHEIDIDKLKISTCKKRSIFQKSLEFNSKLSEIQRNFERYLQKNI